MIITIGGPSGSGKTTISKLLSNALNYEYVSVGKLMRQKAKELGFEDIEAFQTHLNAHPEIDREMDMMIVEYAKTHKNGLLEGRLPGWMCHTHGVDCYKIWLTAEVDVRAKRVGSRDHQSLEDAQARVKMRDAQHAQRFRELYSIDIEDLSIYNLVIPTDTQTPEEILNTILANIKEK